MDITNPSYDTVSGQFTFLQLLLHRLWTHKGPTQRRTEQLLVIKVPIVIRHVDALHPPRGPDMWAMHFGPDPRKQNVDLSTGDTVRPNVVIVPKGLASQRALARCSAIVLGIRASAELLDGAA